MRKLLIILFCFIATSLSAQTTYYVATAGGGGNNANPGTLASPWLTIQYAENNIAAGDTVFVRGGTYNEAINYNLVKVTGKFTTFKEYSTENAIIDGTGIDANLALFLCWEGNVIIDGFTFANADMAGGTQDANAIYFTEDSSTLKNCLIHDIWASGVTSLGDYNVIENCTIYNVCMENSDGIYVPPETWGAGLNVRGTSAIARHNTLHDGWGEGLSFTQSDYGTVEDNIIYDFFSGLLYIQNSQDCIVQRNMVYMTKTMGTVKGVIASVGLLHQDELPTHVNTRNTLINNIVYSCDRNLYNSSDLNECLIANNTFVNSNVYWCVQFTGTGSAGGVVANNIFIQDDALPIAYAIADVNVTYKNNLYNKAYDADMTGAGDVTNDPHFINPVTHDYTLSATSHAIDVGLAGLGINTDYFEALRDATPDIGAYEYDPPVSPPAVLPSIITYGVTSAWSGGGTGAGNVTDDGDGTISARGVCVATTANPDLTKSVFTTTGTTGAFTVAVTGLLPSTTYHVRAYVTNEIGTVYGSDITFDTPAFSYVIDGTGKFVIDGTGKFVIR